MWCRGIWLENAEPIHYEYIWSYENKLLVDTIASNENIGSLLPREIKEVQV